MLFCTGGVPGDEDVEFEALIVGRVAGHVGDAGVDNHDVLLTVVVQAVHKFLHFTTEKREAKT